MTYPGSMPHNLSEAEINYKADDESTHNSDAPGSEVCVDDAASQFTHSSSSLSENEQKENIFVGEENIGAQDFNVTVNAKGHIQEEVVAIFFEPEGVKKARISIWDIVQIIEDRVNSTILNSNYTYILLLVCCYFGLLPYFYQVSSLLIHTYSKNSFSWYQVFITLLFWYQNNSWIVNAEMLLIVIVRFILFCSLFFLLSVADRTYRLRYLYGKHFGALTSSRRAKRNHLPHFRLHKVRNIKAWLSLRSYLRKCGPLRNIDLIVSWTFFLAIMLIVIVCGKFLVDLNYPTTLDKTFIEEYLNWEIPSLALFLSSYLLHFMSLGAEINRKYSNHSELLTEQINLYLQMEICPQKKEEFLIANNVLKLASKLIKEVEAPQRVNGFIMNPLLRNITKVVILSLVSGVISEIFGVSFKFWKIKAS